MLTIIVFRADKLHGYPGVRMGDAVADLSWSEGVKLLTLLGWGKTEQ